LNSLIHRELQNRGDVSKDEHKLRVLESRQEMTGADRQWAGQYEPGDVLRYSRGSKSEGIKLGEYAEVTSVDAKENRLTVEREAGTVQTYDPRRLSGVSVHREAEREFSRGDRVQFTAPSRELNVANRDLGTVEQVNSQGDLRIRMDSGQEVRFNVREHPHLDYGYAVTSHSSQGQTADRVLIHVDTEKSELLVTTALRTYPFRGLNTMPTFTRMTEGRSPVVSVAKVRNVQRQRWSNSRLPRRPNQSTREGDGPPMRSKVIVWE